MLPLKVGALPMHRFHISPTDKSYPSAEMISPDAAGVLHLVQRLKCKEADVMRDGVYCFSVYLGDNGSWCIFQRERSAGAEILPFNG